MTMEEMEVIMATTMTAIGLACSAFNRPCYNIYMSCRFGLSGILEINSSLSPDRRVTLENWEIGPPLLDRVETYAVTREDKKKL